MFQLIVAVISIALVVALSLASLYFGGSAFQNSSLKANVTTLVNAAQQISGADALYKTAAGGVGADSIDDLTAEGEYLAATPSISAAAKAGVGDVTWSIASITVGTAPDENTYRVATVLLDGDEAAQDVVCEEIERQAGGDFDKAQFGCTGTAAARSFAFKL